AAVAGPLDGGIHGERVRAGVEGCDALHVERDLRFLVPRADQVVEHRGLGGGKLLIEKPRLARVDRGAERGALGFLPEASESHHEVAIELANRPEGASRRDERDAQARERVEVLAASIGPGPPRRGEDEDRPRPFAEAFRHRLQRAWPELDEHLLAERSGEKQVADEQQRLHALAQPGQERRSPGTPHTLEADESQPRPAAAAPSSGKSPRPPGGAFPVRRQVAPIRETSLAHSALPSERPLRARLAAATKSAIAAVERSQSPGSEARSESAAARASGGRA